jgi:hypothetical protein
VSKGSKNKESARARLAQMRAIQARRRRRRWLAGIAAAAVAVAAAVAIALTVVTGGNGTSSATSASSASSAAEPQLKLAPLSTIGALTPAPSPGPPGPEGVAVPSAPPLAGVSTGASGQSIDGISCQASEQVLFHIHAHLTIFVNGSPRQVPAAVGIPGAVAQNTPQGPFVGGGTCFYWLHTHAADGVIHVESPVKRTYTLGDFFDEWGQPLSVSQVGPATGHVTAIYNHQVYRGNPRDIPLTAHAQIQLDVGTPHAAPETISWPSGL